jgi:hypothetical protein
LFPRAGSGSTSPANPRVVGSSVLKISTVGSISSRASHPLSQQPGTSRIVPNPPLSSVCASAAAVRPATLCSPPATPPPTSSAHPAPMPFPCRGHRLVSTSCGLRFPGKRPLKRNLSPSLTLHLCFAVHCCRCFLNHARAPPALIGSVHATFRSGTPHIQRPSLAAQGESDEVVAAGNQGELYKLSGGGRQVLTLLRSATPIAVQGSQERVKIGAFTVFLLEKPLGPGYKLARRSSCFPARLWSK